MSIISLGQVCRLDLEAIDIPQDTDQNTGIGGMGSFHMKERNLWWLIYLMTGVILSGVG